MPFTLVRIVRLLLVSGLLAALCSLGGIAGAVVALGGGCVSLTRLPRLPSSVSEAGDAPHRREFGAWLLAAFSFSIVVLAFSIWTQFLPAATVALMLLSPLFGLTACLIEVAAFRTIIAGDDDMAFPAAVSRWPRRH